MREIEIGVVITYSAGREENVATALDYLFEMSITPKVVVLVLDGKEPEMVQPPPNLSRVDYVRIPKHQPGQEQPRNAGARRLVEHFHQLTHAWFLDSDLIVSHNALNAYVQTASVVGKHTVMIGPYEWMPEGVREPMPNLYNDPRWDMFRERGLGPFVADLGVALGCFGGNLVWPIEDFVRIGGFHPQLYHGRCEDGELGLRAASHRIPMALVPAARAYHMEHQRNHQLAEERNRRDVPLLNSWHPWVSQKGLIVTDKDGARFDFVCSCGTQVNTLEIWSHFAEYRHDPGELILPEGMG